VLPELTAVVENLQNALSSSYAIDVKSVELWNRFEHRMFRCFNVLLYVGWGLCMFNEVNEDLGV
jgi:hypothetical protein